MDATHQSEQWRPVEGRFGEYEVSDQGRIRSLDRTITTRQGQRFVRGLVLKPAAGPHGYLHVVLAGRQTVLIHHAVAAAFIGPRPTGAEVRHRNGNPLDNRAVNLEYGTRSDNTEDSKSHGTHFHAGLTHCKRGHELSGSNLQQTVNGKRRTCLACRRDRQKLYDAGRTVVPAGECPHGHPMTPENRYTNGNGRTRCKPCALESRRRREIANAQRKRMGASEGD